MRYLFGILTVVCVLLPDAGYTEEREPNDACLAAQDLGELALPARVSGFLDSGDVDFILVTLDAGTTGVRIDMLGAPSGEGTLADPYLGVFDADCNLQRFNDDAFQLESTIFMRVPPDGVLILAATSCCDSAFVGDGGYQGSYTLALSETRALAEVRGRVVDAFSRLGLRGDDDPFATVELYRCANRDCTSPEYVTSVSPSTTGEFTVVRDDFGNPLAAGLYTVRGFANTYENLEVGPFSLGEDEVLDLGDLEMRPPRIQITDVSPCASIPAGGGACRFDLRVRGASPQPFNGYFWGQVTVSGTGNAVNSTEFQVGHVGVPSAGPSRLRLRALQEKDLRMQFYVPNTVALGAELCVETRIGEGESVHRAVFDVVVDRFLFCVVKRATGFTVLDTSDLGKRIRKRNRRR